MKRQALAILAITLAACGEAKPSPERTACRSIVPAQFAETPIRRDGFGPSIQAECEWGVMMVNSYNPQQRGYQMGAHSLAIVRLAVEREEAYAAGRAGLLSAVSSSVSPSVSSR